MTTNNEISSGVDEKVTTTKVAKATAAKKAAVKPAAKKAATKKPKHYLTNAALLEAVKDAKAKGYLTDELGKMFMVLVARYASKINFVGYPYNQDLQGQALVNLARGWASFDETRFSNAFAYYTQITHNSFIQYLNHERSHRDIRDACLVDQGMMPSHTYLEALEAAEAAELEAAREENEDGKIDD